MNTGTKIRTALRIAVSLNTAVYAVTAAVGQLGWGSAFLLKTDGQVFRSYVYKHILQEKSTEL